MSTNYKQLPRGQAQWVVAPNIMAMMTGARYANQSHKGIITLTYVDGTIERRKCEHDIEEFASWLALVSYVQAGRGVVTP